MKNFRILKYLFLGLLLNFSVCGKASDFATLCEGNWQGFMHIWAQGRLVDSVQVFLTVTPWRGEAGHWIWKTGYESAQGTVLKDYTLHKVAEFPEVYELDEGEGVRLRNFVFGNEMMCFFSVKGAQLMSSYLLQSETLIFSVYSYGGSKERSGGVTSYSADYFQRVCFKKIKNE